MEKKRVINNGKIRIKASELLSKFKLKPFRLSKDNENTGIFIDINEKRLNDKRDEEEDMKE